MNSWRIRERMNPNRGLTRSTCWDRLRSPKGADDGQLSFARASRNAFRKSPRFFRASFVRSSRSWAELSGALSMTAFKTGSISCVPTFSLSLPLLSEDSSFLSVATWLSIAIATVWMRGETAPPPRNGSLGSSSASNPQSTVVRRAPRYSRQDCPRNFEASSTAWRNL